MFLKILSDSGFAPIQSVLTTSTLWNHILNLCFLRKRLDSGLMVSVLESCSFIQQSFECLLCGGIVWMKQPFIKLLVWTSHPRGKYNLQQLAIFYLFFTELQLTYHTVLDTSVQQSDSVVYVYTHTSYIYFSRFFSIVGYYKMLNIVPWATQ